MDYLRDLEKVKTLDELDALERRRYLGQYRAQFGDDVGSILQLLAFGIDETKRAAREGTDAELELHIDF